MLCKSKLLTLEPCEIYVFGWDMYIYEYCFMGPSGRFYYVDDVDDWDKWFLGRAPRTRETLPDFLESCRIARHSRVFCELTGSQWTPGNGASQ